MQERKVIDFQTQMTTEKGALFPIGFKSFFEKTFKCKIPYHQTEDEMIEVYRKANIKAILVGPTSTLKDFDEVAKVNNYIAELIDTYPDDILGAWFMFNASHSLDKWLEELERCIKDCHFFGPWHYGASSGIPANDSVLKPVWKLCARKKVPVKISCGHTAAGAGTPGGSGLKLKYERPIPYIDDVAADFPKLTIVAAHMPWPWHHEMVSVLIHKGNVYNETHGWSPLYYPESFLKDCGRRVRRKILFGSDWPFLTFDRLYGDWETASKKYDFKPDALENIYYNNAEKLFKKLKIKI